MINNFGKFASAVARQWNEMANDTLYEVDADRDAVWDVYLGSFPTGSNPLFRKRTEHDCSCCRHFIRDIGNVVAIQNGALSSVWDLNGLPEPYQSVADAMSKYVKGLAIRDVFLTYEDKRGNSYTYEEIDGSAHRWEHFCVPIPRNHRVAKSEVDTKLGKLRTAQQVLYRAVMELDPEAVTQVLDLIDSNQIYRVAEHRKAVESFQKMQELVLSAPVGQRNLIAWQQCENQSAHFRNTAIGTLVQDLSDPNVDLEVAIKKFESKVAPENYKRTTAVITKQMVAKAAATIEQLGLEPALERRHAKLSDVSVNSVLFVDRAARSKMKGGVTDLLMQEVKPVRFDSKHAHAISIHDFIDKVLPETTALNLLVENKHVANFVSLTAPAHDDVEKLFRWDNNFAWSYDGNFADSMIKQRVKNAGGQVEGVAMRVSLAWSNYDDLDLHCHDPHGRHIYFSDRYGILDVDMNAGGMHSRTPVENMRWEKTPRGGLYKFSVHQFNKRESVDVGFEIEVEIDGNLYNCRYDKAVANNLTVPVLNVTFYDGEYEVDFGKEVIAGTSSREHWGLKTQDFVRVNSLILSPNYWDDNAVGNKHWFFILDGCKNPQPARGFYNEFLSSRLEQHRKVFEVLGDKMKVPVTEQQMSGVGFSSTRRDKVTVMAMGPKLNKPYTIAF